MFQGIRLSGLNLTLSDGTRFANLYWLPSGSEALQFCLVRLNVGHIEAEMANDCFHLADSTAISAIMLVSKGFRFGCRSIRVVGLLLIALHCSDGQTLQGDSGKSSSGPLVPGQSMFGKNDFIEYVVGNLPIIISVPHGGYLKPENIPDRDLGTPGRQDTGTQELAREIVAEFRDRTGKVPHVIINRLHRSKLDANRELFDAAQDDPVASRAWKEYHDFIDSAEHQIQREFRLGLYIDLHGHRHTLQMVELGYLLVANQLKMSDVEIDSAIPSASTSFSVILKDETMPLSQLLRGPRSLGAAFEQKGFATVPSPAHPHPDGQPYFSGGYNLEQHSSFSGKQMMGIQVETPTGIREDDSRRREFAKAFVASVMRFMEDIGIRAVR